MKTCKDCKFFKQTITEKGWGKCTLTNTMVREEWPRCNNFVDFNKKGGDEK